MSEIKRHLFLERAATVIRAESQAVLAMLDSLDDGFVAAAREIVDCRGKIIVTGSGTSGTIAQRAAHLLSVGGSPAFYLSPADGLHGGLGVIQPEDMVIALSKGGCSTELNEFCSRARTLGKCVIVITATDATPLTRNADHIILMKLEQDADLGGVLATGSTLATSAIIDALIDVARIARGYSWEKVLFTHPSGAVGRNREETLERLASKEK